MRAAWRALAMGLITVGCLSFGCPSARAQGPGPRGSLGGYGASMSPTDPGMGTSGLVIPYAGMSGGFMPSRMGGGSSLSFRSRGVSAILSTRTTVSLAPMSGGTSSMSSGMGRGLGSRSRMSTPVGSMGSGGGMRRPMSGAGGIGVMPPNFGYPFYQPPSLLTSSTSAGMSM